MGRGSCAPVQLENPAADPDAIVDHDKSCEAAEDLRQMEHEVLNHAIHQSSRKPGMIFTVCDSDNGNDPSGSFW